MHVLVVGGGVIGLMQARELAQRGMQVSLLEKGQLGAEASWAGGGIISPLYPWRYSDPVTALASWSQAYYPELIDTIKSESDIDPELSQHGLLMLSVHDQKEALSWSQRSQNWLEQIGADKVQSLEPNLGERLESALWMSRVASVRNPRLLKALKKIAHEHENINVLENFPVELIQSHERGVKVTGQSGRSIEADRLILCTGAWTRYIINSPPLQIEPVKGQMLVIDAEPGLVNRVVLSNGKYVIPRLDGRIVVGSTLEHTRFEKQTTTAAREQLLKSAYELFPILREYTVSHHWAGLRPGTPDGIPYIGAMPGHHGVYVNAGHFRNGLVLAPASVRLMSQLLCDESTIIDPSPYAPA